MIPFCYKIAPYFVNYIVLRKHIKSHLTCIFPFFIAYLPVVTNDLSNKNIALPGVALPCNV